MKCVMEKKEFPKIVILGEIVTQKFHRGDFCNAKKEDAHVFGLINWVTLALFQINKGKKP